MRLARFAALLAVSALLLPGCFPNINLFGQAPEALSEKTLQGEADPKIVMITIRGVISDEPEERFITEGPSMVQQVVARLRKAASDPKVGAVVLKIESPGGSVTASDVLYHEIMQFKEKTGAKVLAAFMGVAASGAYYISMAADHITAHPTTVTGSVGVVFARPQVTGLMDKIGVDVHMYTTGKHKDMGSPFRDVTDEEKEIIKGLVGSMGDRFVGLVKRHRNLSAEALETVKTARVFFAPQAKELGLVDSVGYLEDVFDQAKKLAGLPENARVVVYRTQDYPNDTVYNDAAVKAPGRSPPVVDLGLPRVNGLNAGFYYLWPSAMISR
ncbi:MAG: signal peptide peptidase SppA [Deltaproteobacteria bacterium]|nr:signal peptide peptidase SppA [Deltaproteobacteria bacterium]